MLDPEIASPVIDGHLAVAARVFKNIQLLRGKGVGTCARGSSAQELLEKNTPACLEHIEKAQREQMRLRGLIPAE